MIWLRGGNTKKPQNGISFPTRWPLKQPCDYQRDTEAQPSTLIKFCPAPHWSETAFTRSDIPEAGNFYID